MKQTIIILLSLFIFSCKSESKPKKTDLADVNIILKSDVMIDSIWISDIGQTESFFLPIKDTIKVDFKKRLNDLYNLEVFTENGSKTSQFWLNGNHLIVDATFKEKLHIDTIQNSDLYYNAIDFSQTFRKLIKDDADSLTIDNFLMEKVRENINNPFSFDVANKFIYRNQNDQHKIRTLFDELSEQNDTLKNHFISVHSRIENILKVNTLDFSEYQLADINNEMSSIELDNSKTYLLDFWFVNCPPCIKDHKLISQKLEFLNEHNIELIGISTDKDHIKWKDYLKEHGYNWNNYREIDSLETMTKAMAIWSFPTYLHLNTKGDIKARFNSFEDFEKYINK
ncbi:TlpA family protein disulfide reductase [Psychroserpens sp. XS_ASV72]|uniref:TlpA family protein disulfide reductase n=1 Tax=Psychroserpens sp. XS_ASV72 TaxID=3241293 RepID=UPI00351182FD